MAENNRYGWCQSCGALVFNSLQCHKCDGKVKPFCVDMQLVEQAERIKKLETQLEQHRWIPVSKKLPEKTEEDLRPEVLVYDGESVTGALWRQYNFGWDFETDRGKPTHWKPIILP